MKTLLIILLLSFFLKSFGQTPCQNEIMDGIAQFKLEPKSDKGNTIKLELMVIVIDQKKNKMQGVKIELVGKFGIIYESGFTDENGEIKLTNLDNEKLFFVRVELNEKCIKQKIDFFKNANDNLNKDLTIIWRKN